MFLTCFQYKLYKKVFGFAVSYVFSLQRTKWTLIQGQLKIEGLKEKGLNPMEK